MKKNIVLIIIQTLAIAIYGQTANDYRTATNNGDASSQFHLGWCYENGRGVAQDYAQAVYWFRKAADQGDVNAQRSLGAYYALGRGVSQDYTQAAFWTRKAAEQGVDIAQYNIATCYANGQGVPQDYAQAVYWYRKAADQGYAEAQANLGHCYITGRGVSQDYAQAVYWYRKAADQGLALAQDELAWCYSRGKGVSQDYTQAVYWYRKAADQGYSFALGAMAYLYAEGHGVSQDFNEAYKYVDSAIANASDENKPLHLDYKGEIALKAGDKALAQKIWKEFRSKYSTKIKDFSSEENNVFVKTMLKGLNDVDSDIPLATASASNTFAYIIANEEYKNVSKVPYAKNDGNVFAEYCKKTLGIPDNNVKVWNDATLGDMMYAINKMKKIAQAYENDANIIIYYAGHGIPSDDQQNSYLLPVDGYGAGESSISLRELYNTLGKLNVNSVFIILDACFSGAQRNGEMFASTRGVAIKPKQDIPDGNLIVLSAAQGDETAMPYNDKEHGLFSYYLLKKLQESKGNCTIGELADYITTNVKRTSISIGDKIQTPKISASSTIGDWRNIKLK